MILIIVPSVLIYVVVGVLIYRKEWVRNQVAMKRGELKKWDALGSEFHDYWCNYHPNHPHHANAIIYHNSISCSCRASKMHGYPHQGWPFHAAIFWPLRMIRYILVFVIRYALVKPSMLPLNFIGRLLHPEIKIPDYQKIKEMESQ